MAVVECQSYIKERFKCRKKISQCSVAQAPRGQNKIKTEKKTKSIQDKYKHQMKVAMYEG